MRRHLSKLLPLLVLLAVPAMCGNTRTECEQVRKSMSDFEATINHITLANADSRGALPSKVDAHQKKLRSLELTNTELAKHVTLLADAYSRSAAALELLLVLYKRLETLRREAKQSEAKRDALEAISKQWHEASAEATKLGDAIFLQQSRIRSVCGARLSH